MILYSSPIHWTPTTVGIIIFGIIVSIYWILFAYAFDETIDEYFDSPKIKLPDQITIEIVREKKNSPAEPSASQTSPSSPTSEQAVSSVSAHCPKEKEEVS